MLSNFFYILLSLLTEFTEYASYVLASAGSVTNVWISPQPFPEEDAHAPTSHTAHIG